MTRPAKLKRDPWAKLVSRLPWDDEGDEVFIYDADGVPVATTDKAWLPYDVRIANNRFIIRACNVHDELLAALKSIQDSFVQDGRLLEGHKWLNSDITQAAFDNMRAAIAKAEGR